MVHLFWGFSVKILRMSAVGGGGGGLDECLRQWWIGWVIEVMVDVGKK